MKRVYLIEATNGDRREVYPKWFSSKESAQRKIKSSKSDPAVAKGTRYRIMSYIMEAK